MNDFKIGTPSRCDDGHTVAGGQLGQHIRNAFDLDRLGPQKLLVECVTLRASHFDLAIANSTSSDEIPARAPRGHELEVGFLWQ
jgi:hypothetical protein